MNVALNSGVRANIVWNNIENRKQEKSLINTPEWSNTFGPDCLKKMRKISSNFSSFAVNKPLTTAGTDTKLCRYDIQMLVQVYVNLNKIPTLKDLIIRAR